MRTIVINLKYRKDRLEQMQQQASEHDFTFELFEAIKAKATDKINAGHHGCFLSHKSVLQTITEDTLILEDDAVLMDGFIELVKFFMKQLPYYWDLFYLGGWKTEVRPFTMNLEKADRVLCTHAYIVTPSFAKVLLENMDEPDKIDKVFARVSGNKFIANPILAWQREGFSDIEKKVTDNQHLK